MIEFTLNGKAVKYEGDGKRPLLWYVRDELNLTGSKYGCGIAQCGACTMHLNGAPVRSCSVPMSAVAGGKVTTIEGLDGKTAEAVQQAWQSLDVVQCGYCQSGQVMSAVALLANNQAPNDADIDQAMEGNLCRCATYQRIRGAIHQAADNLAREA
ncbi:(2Fe-2S)-binding protein [Bowmanella dokdonensis]|uniref:(2Fe-2S)-binding protein n=1 Tax=Bowmanella dokdonensis TaxID=751969 RepID=A0A939DNE3_9ALTE|nr:(2Fe-2S)-binding protein [Bowmanella dokdonensis]MBN7825713.1 (2Fe-2S)-binding protein [Bowmanella dokdonensis]